MVVVEAVSMLISLYISGYPVYWKTSFWGYATQLTITWFRNNSGLEEYRIITFWMNDCLQISCLLDSLFPMNDFILWFISIKLRMDAVLHCELFVCVTSMVMSDILCWLLIIEGKNTWDWKVSTKTPEKAGTSARIHPNHKTAGIYMLIL